MAKRFSIVRLEERVAPASWHTGPVNQDGGQHYDADNPSGGNGHYSHGNGHGYGQRGQSGPSGGQGYGQSGPSGYGGGQGYGQGGQYQGEAVPDGDVWRFRRYKILSGWGWGVDRSMVVSRTDVLGADKASRGGRPAAP